MTTEDERMALSAEEEPKYRTAKMMTSVEVRSTARSGTPVLEFVFEKNFENGRPWSRANE